MNLRARKFAGVFVLIGLVVVWAAVATAIYETLPADVPNWLLVIYFAVAGLGWFVPAALAIRWMQAPR
jgi:Protein of unknown function (DUF2842)